MAAKAPRIIRFSRTSTSNSTIAKWRAVPAARERNLIEPESGSQGLAVAAHL